MVNSFMICMFKTNPGLSSRKQRVQISSFTLYSSTINHQLQTAQHQKNSTFHHVVATGCFPSAEVIVGAQWNCLTCLPCWKLNSFTSFISHFLGSKSSNYITFHTEAFLSMKDMIDSVKLDPHMSSTSLFPCTLCIFIAMLHDHPSLFVFHI